MYVNKNKKQTCNFAKRIYVRKYQRQIIKQMMVISAGCNHNMIINELLNNSQESIKPTNVHMHAFVCI